MDKTGVMGPAQTITILFRAVGCYDFDLLAMMLQSAPQKHYKNNNNNTFFVVVVFCLHGSPNEHC